VTLLFARTLIGPSFIDNELIGSRLGKSHSGDLRFSLGLTCLFTITFHGIRYRWIALETFYQVSSGCDSIGSTIQSENHF
jgi:hypothetical protein